MFAEIFQLPAFNFRISLLSSLEIFSRTCTIIVTFHIIKLTKIRTAVEKLKKMNMDDISSKNYKVSSFWSFWHFFSSYVSDQKNATNNFSFCVFLTLISLLWIKENKNMLLFSVYRNNGNYQTNKHQTLMKMKNIFITFSFENEVKYGSNGR